MWSGTSNSLFPVDGQRTFPHFVVSQIFTAALHILFCLLTGIIAILFYSFIVDSFCYNVLQTERLSMCNWHRVLCNGLICCVCVCIARCTCLHQYLLLLLLFICTTRKIVSEMTYNVSMGTLNPTIPSFVQHCIYLLIN